MGENNAQGVISLIAI